MKAKIEVLSPGLFSTIQDLGRYNYRKYGVPISGLMDAFSAKMGNLILQNSEDCAVLEITQMGPKLKFQSPAKIAITGADLSPKINSEAIKNNQLIFINEGDVLSFGNRKNGCRAYLSISGGFQTETVLGSKCWYEGISVNAKLEKGMMLEYFAEDPYNWKTNSAVKIKTDHITQSHIEVEEGPEFHLLPSSSSLDLFNIYFKIDKNNSRMAIQLSEKFENDLESIITSPVIPGTVQLTPSGNLIVLMKDCQTTGGYPRVLQLSEQGMNVLAQKIMGDTIQFRLKNKAN